MENGSQTSVTTAVKGETGLYKCNGLSFPVRILDARKVYGRIDVQIQPVGGEGERWVEASAVVMSSAK